MFPFSKPKSEMDEKKGGEIGETGCGGRDVGELTWSCTTDSKPVRCCCMGKSPLTPPPNQQNQRRVCREMLVLEDMLTYLESAIPTHLLQFWISGARYR